MPAPKTLLRALEDLSMPEPNSGCYLWIGALNSKGYGKIGTRRDCKETLAHRASYRHHKGVIPEGFDVDHRCHVRCCINPDHLEAVPHLVNVRRSDNFNRLKKHCKNGHEFVGNNIYVWKGYRHCRTCRDVARQTSNGG